MIKIFTVLFYSKCSDFSASCRNGKNPQGFLQPDKCTDKKKLFYTDSWYLLFSGPIGLIQFDSCASLSVCTAPEKTDAGKGMIDGLFDGERHFGWESEDRGAARSQMHHSSQTCEGFCSLYIKVYREIHQQMLVYQRRSGCHCVWLLNR